MANSEAKRAFDNMIKMLDSRDWNYEKYEDKLTIRCSIAGQDLPIECLMMVQEANQVVQVYSTLPCRMPEDKRVDGAIAVCVANYGLCNGSFDYDISDGEIYFRLTTSYTETVLSDELMERMLFVAAATIDKFNDKFFMLAKNMMSLQQFIEGEGSSN